MARARVGLVMLVLALGSSSATTRATGGESRQEASASEGWVQLPVAGANTAPAFAVVKNPTMYDIYLVSAASEVAGTVEFRDGGGGEDAKVAEVTVPAYGSVTLRPDGLHLQLVDLKRALKKNESITVILTTDSSTKLELEAVVREP